MGAMVGALIGAYMCGVTVTHGTHPIGPIEHAVRDDFAARDGFVAIAEYTQITIVGLLAGGIIGAPFGAAAGYVIYRILRRSGHNASRLLERVLGEQIDRVKQCRLFAALGKLNKAQKVTIAITVGLLILLLLFPPWIGSETQIIIPEGLKDTFDYPRQKYEFAGFRWVFSGEDARLDMDTPYVVAKVHYKLLAVLLVAVTGSCAALLFALRSNRVGNS
ncbi:MAG: hypothetical protein ACYTEX_28455 [Planctomycetota bacterium]|jgi:hypothetical protein